MSKRTDAQVDDLYDLPLEDFVGARDALARELRQAGDREAADEVKRLAKPNRAAWAVNQLMRSQPRARRSLVEAAAAAQRAGTSLGTPEAADELRLAASAGRRAVSELMTAARGLVSADGKSLGDAPLQGVNDTLLAALADPEAREAVEEARLTRELRSTGFPLAAAAGAPSPASPRKGAKRTAKKPAPKPRETAKAKRERAKAEREAAETERAREAVKRARAELTRCEREVARARTTAEAAVEALQEAERARDRAQRGLEKTEKQARA